MGFCSSIGGKLRLQILAFCDSAPFRRIFGSFSGIRNRNFGVVIDPFCSCMLLEADFVERSDSNQISQVYPSTISQLKSGMLDLHVDDICETNHSDGVKALDGQHDAPLSSFQRRTFKHIKLFKEYLSTCNQIGDDFASPSSTVNSSVQRSIPVPQGSICWDSFLKKSDAPRTSMPLPRVAVNDKGNSIPPPRSVIRDPKLPRRSLPSISWAAESLSQPAPRAEDSAFNARIALDFQVYQRQVASALSSGKTVWL
jgi:hypothetical protein